MVNLLLQKINKNTIFKNFTSLSLLQLSNYIFPLITFPYIVRIIGPEKFGLVNFSTSFTAYFILLTDYGFSLSAVREISRNRNNEKLSTIFNSIMFIKIALFILSMVLFLSIVIIVPEFRNNFLVYASSFLYVIGSVLFPLWFFQGMEEMNYITIITVIIRSLLTSFIFLVITKESDFLLWNTLNSVASIAIGLTGLCIVIFKFNIKLVIPSLMNIKYYLKEGWHEFISLISINLYTVSNTVILGLFTNNISVGYFAGANKICTAFQSIFTVFLQAVYPHVSNLFGKSHIDGIKFTQKLLKNFWILGFTLSLILFLFADKLVLLILGNQFYKSILLVKIIAVLPFTIFISNILGIQTMLNLGYKKAFFNIVGFMGFFNLLISFIIVPRYHEIGTTISMIITEILVTISMYIFLYKHGINFFKKYV